MKLLLYQWGANNESLLETSLKALGHQVFPFAHECKHYTKDMELSMAMITKLHEVGAEGIISFNYFPILSLIAEAGGIPYFSWVYDCPHFTLYSAPVLRDVNRIGIFDEGMVRELKGKAVNTVFHLPLGITDFSLSNSAKYSCDVSFVGSLYTGEYDYYSLMDKDLIPGAEAAIEARVFNYSEDRGKKEDKNIHGKSGIEIAGIEAAGAETVRAKTVGTKTAGAETAGTETAGIEMTRAKTDMSEVRRDPLREYLDSGVEELDYFKAFLTEHDLRPGEEYFMQDEEIIRAAILEKEVTVRERKKLLSCIGEHFKNNFQFHIHTASKNPPRELLPFIKGPVDYHREMPQVFKNSKINLNITLRSIHTGIPLRVLDILSCGGFVLSNYQEELAEYFKVGEELELFENPDEAAEKIDYYLTHEEERQKIAGQGQQAVWERFDLKQQLKKLLSR